MNTTCIPSEVSPTILSTSGHTMHIGWLCTPSKNAPHDYLWYINMKVPVFTSHNFSIPIFMFYITHILILSILLLCFLIAVLLNDVLLSTLYMTDDNYCQNYSWIDFPLLRFKATYTSINDYVFTMKSILKSKRTFCSWNFCSSISHYLHEIQFRSGLKKGPFSWTGICNTLSRSQKQTTFTLA